MSDKIKKILIIDDDEDYQTLLSALLTLDGYETFTAYNPLDGINILEKERPDLIIMELMLPYLEGTRFIDWLEEENRHEIPILIITSLNRHEGTKTAEAANVKEILFKPSHRTDILYKIKNILRE